MKYYQTSALLAIAILSMPNAARASFLSIDDATSEKIIVSANDFEGGLSVNGTLLQQGLGQPASISLDETVNGLTFSGAWLDLGQTTPGSFTIAFTEGGGTLTPPVVSDILTFSYDTDGRFGHLLGTFVSDVEGAPPLALPPGATLWPESRGAFDFSNAFITAIAMSDFEVPDSGPGMVGWTALLGLCGLGVRQNFRRHSIV